ncbi:MAG: hypothetical protein GXY55_07500 [Phycisphaerae bacterium]|nr:hypothetical protein [Phycisphaerae bacterium]
MNDTNAAVPLSWRLLGALGAGCLCALPVGWLLATLVLLPFFLGLFFCMLLGLLIGAVIFRVAAPGKPFARPTLWLVGLAVAACVCFVSLVGEYYNVRGYDLPFPGTQGWQWHSVDGDATTCVRQTFAHRSFTPDQISQLRSETRQNFLNLLATHHPPGGLPGFVRWSLNGQALECPRIFSPHTTSLVPKQSGVKWVIRLVLAFVLTAGAILSQVLGLGPASPAADEDKPDDKPVETEDARTKAASHAAHKAGQDDATG